MAVRAGVRVLPPTVLAYLLLVTFSRRGHVGRFIAETFDYSILFRFEGAVLAGTVVALPMLYLPAKAAFQTVDRDLEDAARTFGATRLQSLWHISLPMARRGILAGLIMAFARVLGEFGATVMVFGWQPGKMTLPTSIYAAYERGEASDAAPAVLVLLVMSLLLVGIHTRLAGRRGE